MTFTATAEATTPTTPAAAGESAAAPSAAACAAAHTPVPDGLPDVPCPREVDPGEARQLTRVFFERLRSLEEGTPEYQYVRNTLIEMNISLVNFAARPFRDRPGGPENEDIVQVGTIGLIKAIDRYELDRNTQFSTLALPYITGEIKRHFRDTTWAVRVPRRLQELRTQLARSTEDLTSATGRAPTPGELAEHLDLDEEEVRQGLVAANGYSAQSLDAPSGSGDEPAPSAGRSTHTLAETLGDTDQALDTVEDLHSLAPLLSGLDERTTRILQLRFGQEMTQRQIGEEIGMSQMHVSRLLTRTLGALREELLRDD
ncbi:SigB/SigF/SigG family RNA polymerase sigma factor [Streptomyces sp. NPDC058157]|uniref:SigB/SigF/SigG family RNA polymerase sigma factor n=1 Tax=Streptomyces sp. NPDC058157 TaxID=3346360 RepID=UPI0036DFF0FA